MWRQMFQGFTFLNSSWANSAFRNILLLTGPILIFFHIGASSELKQGQNLKRSTERRILFLIFQDYDISFQAISHLLSSFLQDRLLLGVSLANLSVKPSFLVDVALWVLLFIVSVLDWSLCWCEHRMGELTLQTHPWCGSKECPDYPFSLAFGL